jgi:hypothetical protein
MVKRFFGFSINEIRDMTPVQFNRWAEEMGNIYDLESGQPDERESVEDIRARAMADPAVRVL